jgi:hypothetical protein
MGQMSLHPPFRAEHIGSLVRPPELLRARARHAAGELDREELAAIEDKAIRGAIDLQEGVGLEVITDGNLSRRAAHHRSGAADTQSLEPQISDLRDEADAVRAGGRRRSCGYFADDTPIPVLDPGRGYAEGHASRPLLYSLPRVQALLNDWLTESRIVVSTCHALK